MSEVREMKGVDMVKNLQIELSDGIYAAMLVLSQVIEQSPEEMASEWVTMAVTAITGKPLQIAKSMSLGSPLATPLGMPGGIPGSMSAGTGPYDMLGMLGGTRSGSQAKATLPPPNKESTRAIYQLKVTLK